MLNDILFDNHFITRSKDLVSGEPSAYSMDGSYYDYLAGAPIQTEFSLTINNIVPGTEVRIYRQDNRLELFGVESSLSSLTYQYTYTSNIIVYIVLINIDYEYLIINNVVLTNKDNIIPIIQRKRLF